MGFSEVILLPSILQKRLISGYLHLLSWIIDDLCTLDYEVNH